MATLFVRHTVADYSAWRKVYESVAELQKKGGVLAQAVYRASDNPNDVTVTHEFASAKAAIDFVSGQELKAAMHKGGVVGAPEIWVAEKA